MFKPWINGQPIQDQHISQPGKSKCVPRWTRYMVSPSLVNQSVYLDGRDIWYLQPGKSKCVPRWTRYIWYLQPGKSKCVPRWTRYMVSPSMVNQRSKAKLGQVEVGSNIAQNRLFSQ